MSDNYTADSEKFEIVHKMSRRIASVDKYCVISVANKAFEEYFGEIKETLIEVVAPQDKERLMDFIEKYDGTAKSGMFKFINAQGIERYNHLFVYERRAVGNGHMRDIELVDVESIEEANKSLRDDVSKHKMLLGLDREYTFTYNRDNGICTGMMLTQEMSYISLILMNGRSGCFRRDILTRMTRKSLLILYQKYALIRRHFL